MAKANIAIVTQPLPNVNGGHFLLDKFLRVIKPNLQNIFVLTAFYPQCEEKRHGVSIINHPYHENKQFNFKNIIEYVFYQLRLSRSLIKLSQNYNIVIFYLGAMGFIVPLLILKLLNKKVIIIMTGSATESIKTIYRSKMGKIPYYLIYYIFSAFANINFLLANQLIVYTNSAISGLGLSRYPQKIRISSPHYINFDDFHIINEFKNRRNIIGFVGRISEEKGIMNLVEAIPSIIEQHADWSFVIIGNGVLEDKIKEYVYKNNLYGHIEFFNWATREQLLEYYNEMKILILPSFTEGLPNVLIEAMACGTLVLANHVGSVPDIIKDGETGFILENNSPSSIAESVGRVLSTPDLEKITKNGKRFVEENFSYESAVVRWKKTLEEI